MPNIKILQTSAILAFLTIVSYTTNVCALQKGNQIREDFNVISALEQFQKNYLGPILTSDTQNCSINACEAIKIVSQLLVLLKSASLSEAAAKEQDMRNDEAIMAKDLRSLDFDLVKRVRQIESRLRSVEQPVWHLAPGSETEWNHCTSSVCRCNPQTKSFTCWSKNLKTIPVTQVIPMNMVSIDLSRNSLTTLHKDTFRGLTLLRELDLSNNALDFLPFDLFKDLDSLTQLRIQNNQLERLDARIFWKLRHLRLLDLSSNSLSVLPEAIFNHAQRLTVINLSDNKIQNFPPNLLHDQIALEEFDMSRNALIALQSTSMRLLTQLKVLDFSRNAISHISDDFFSGLKSLQTLILHNNEIASVSRKIFENLSDLITLDLTMNHISKIDGNAFEELINLRELFLGQNSLSHIPDGLFLKTTALSRLTFYSNNFTTLESPDFEGLGNLKHLMLNNNILKNLDPATFSPLKNLEKLRIDSNKLQYLPHGALDDLEKLISIKLDKNPWHCDCRALYLARWIREYVTKVWDGKPVCRGPGDLGGQEVGLLRYDDLCDGQWASMLSLSPRLPVRKNRISTPMNYTDYFNLYLKHIYSSSTTSDDLIPNEDEIQSMMPMVKTRIAKLLASDDANSNEFNIKSVIEEEIRNYEKTKN